MNAKFNAENVVVTRRGGELSNGRNVGPFKMRQIVLDARNDYAPHKVGSYRKGSTWQPTFHGDLVVRVTFGLNKASFETFRVVGENGDLVTHHEDGFGTLEPMLAKWIEDPYLDPVLPTWDGTVNYCEPLPKSRIRRDLAKAIKTLDDDNRRAVGRFLQRVGSALMRD